jgi:hypothetical protein
MTLLSDLIQAITTGSATIDFGATPGPEASIAVTGQTLIKATSRPQAWIVGAITATNTDADHLMAGALLRLTCDVPTAGVGFTIYADSLGGLATGTFAVQWSWR